MGAVETTYTFTATDTITSTKMNNIIDQTVITNNAIWLDDGLEVSSGKIRITGNGITSSKLGEGSVTSFAILDGTIVNEDINASAAIALSKLGSGGLPSTITVNSSNIVNGSIETIDIKDANITAPKLSGAQTGSAPVFGVRAWVNFDASRDASGASNTSNTNRFIRSSGNVTSVLKTATGKFTVTFTTAMPNTNYIVTSSVGSSGVPRFSCADRATATTTSIRIETDNLSGSPTDLVENNVIVIA